MEFWGVEVKVGEPLKVPVDDDFVIHLSQVALGESKKDKGSEPIVIFVEFDSKKYVLGTLSRESIPQISLDVVFEKEFALSHNWKNGSVYFCGYKANQGPNDTSEDEFSDSDSLDEDNTPLLPSMNGTADLSVKEAKPMAKSNAPQAGQPAKKVKVTVQKEKDADEDNSSEFDSDDDESGDSDEDMLNAEDGSSDDSDEDEEEEESQPKEKKRTIPVQQKTLLAAKKSRPSTPQNTDAKKGVVHTATPHPAKKAGKSTGSGDQTPKSSGGQFSCKSCKKAFGSESGLEQHTKAKHSS